MRFIRLHRAQAAQASQADRPLETDKAVVCIRVKAVGMSAIMSDLISWLHQLALFSWAVIHTNPELHFCTCKKVLLHLQVAPSWQDAPMHYTYTDDHCRKHNISPVPKL